jgi:hypothetical protein
MTLFAACPLIQYNPPVISSASTATCAENTTLAHALTIADSTIKRVTWAITGGADAADFEISGSTLRWAADTTRDYEIPDDTGTNNSYVVQVTATDLNGRTKAQTITVTVTDVSETPVWLPEGAVAYADFVNGYYYADGAERTSAQWLDHENLAATAAVTANGMKTIDGENAPHLSALVRGDAGVMASTMVFEIVADADVSGYGYFLVALEATGDDPIARAYIVSDSGDIQASTFNGDFESAGELVAGAANKIAATFKATEIAASLNGGAAVVSSNGGDTFTAWHHVLLGHDSNSFATLPLTATGIFPGRIKTVTVYEPVADAALPALSDL